MSVFNIQCELRRQYEYVARLRSWCETHAVSCDRVKVNGKPSIHYGNNLARLADESVKLDNLAKEARHQRLKFTGKLSQLLTDGQITQAEAEMLTAHYYGARLYNRALLDRAKEWFE